MRPARALAAALLAGLLATSGRPAEAMILAPCDEPLLFPGADVNLVVLPYAVGGPDEGYRLRPDLLELLESDVAAKLASLIQLDTLYSLRYPAGLAAVYLTAGDESCTLEETLPKLRDQLGEGKGMALLWGSFLEEDGQVYVQNYLQFFRKGREDTVTVPVALSGSEVVLAGRADRQALGFPPRILTEDDLADISEAGEAARAVWSEADGGSIVAEMPATPEAPFGYYITDVDPRTGRMHIAPHEFLGGAEGWIEAKSDWPLREKLPELDFVDGVIGYLAARIIAEERDEGGGGGRIVQHWAGPWQQRLERARERSQSRLARYRTASAAGAADAADLDARAAVAVSHALSGTLDLVAVASGAGFVEPGEALAAAAGSFAEASAALPYLSDIRNMEAIARAGLADDDPGQAARAVSGWREALSIDPGNALAAANLATVYRRLLEADAAELSGLDPEEVRARLAALER